MLLIVLLLFSAQSFAQTTYSTKENYLRSKSNNNALLLNFANEPVDTSILFTADFGFQNCLGGMGLSAPILKLQVSTRALGFNYIDLPLNESRLSTRQAKFYRSLGPFADLRGTIGAGKLQMFRCFFSQTINNKTNLSLVFNRNTFIGQYASQTAMLNNLAVTANFETANKRFGYYFTLLQNTNRNSENGGISDGVLSAKNANIRKTLLSVNLSSASRDNRQLFIDLKPYLRLNAKDTNATVMHYLQLLSSAEIQSIKYSDKGIASDNFYTTINYDSLRTIDSSNVKQYINGLNYALKTKNNKLAFVAGVRNEQIKLWQKNTTYFDNTIVSSSLLINNEKIKTDSGLTCTKRFSAEANAEQVLNGYNAGDMAAQAIIRLTKTKHHTIGFNLGASFENRKPNQNYLVWRANNFSWTTNYRQQQVLNITAGLSVNKLFALELLYQNINHLLYFNDLALPAQLPGRTDNYAATATLNKVVFKHLGLYVSHTYQQSSSTRELKIPNQITQAKIYYAAAWFKKVLQLNIGAQLRYFQAFEGYAYMPATQMFYAQQVQRGGDFPFVDVYLSGRIKPVSFYVKLENILADYAGYNYFLVPGYYQPNLAFIMGITWQFWD